MASSALSEVRSIMREIDSIRNEIERIQGELRSCCDNVGTGTCASKLNFVDDKLGVVRYSLSRID